MGGRKAVLQRQEGKKTNKRKEAEKGEVGQAKERYRKGKTKELLFPSHTFVHGHYLLQEKPVGGGQTK